MGSHYGAKPLFVKKLKVCNALFWISCALTSCTLLGKPSETVSYAEQYSSHLKQLSSGSSSQTQLPSKAQLKQYFEVIFNSSSSEAEVRAASEALYASSFLFNDTLHTINDRDKLIAYLMKTSSQLTALNVDIQDIVFSGQGAYLRWLMTVEYAKLNKGKPVQTIGITHLHFNQRGKIILHQDFWDSTEGFYQHVTLAKQVIQYIKQHLSDSLEER